MTDRTMNFKEILKELNLHFICKDNTLPISKYFSLYCQIEQFPAEIRLFIICLWVQYTFKSLVNICVYPHIH